MTETARPNTALLWGQPSDLLQLGVMHSNWIWSKGARFGPRPGNRTGFTPVDVIGADAEFATPNISARIAPMLIRANAAGWITRDWTVRYHRILGSGQHHDLRRTLPAVFGYTDTRTAETLRRFANEYGYGYQDLPSAHDDPARAPGVPHVYIADRVALHLGIGQQRTRQDIAAEWSGLNTQALDALAGARQVTIWVRDHDHLWPDLDDHYDSVEVTP